MSVEPHPDGGAPADCYGFAHDLQVGPVARGTSLVVRRSAEADPSALAMRLLAPVSEQDVGALLVETDDTPRGGPRRRTSPALCWLSSAVTVSSVIRQTASEAPAVSHGRAT